MVHFVGREHVFEGVQGADERFLAQEVPALLLWSAQNDASLDRETKVMRKFLRMLINGATKCMVVADDLSHWRVSIL